MPKRSIREKMLTMRRHCSAETCLALSYEIQERFLSSVFFRESKCVALYSAISNEVLTEEIARKALVADKKLVYPRVRESHLEFVEVFSLKDLAPGSFGVLEPIRGAIVPVSAIDVLLVPGVAFDGSGHRLGYGQGFYDRILFDCGSQTKSVGLAYDFQLVKRLPVQDHDQPVSALVTESCLMVFRSSA